MNINKIKEVIQEKEKCYSFNDYVLNYTDDKELAEIADTDELREYLEEINEEGQVTDVEVIYYATAMEYLKENDPSLNESIELAYNLGFELKNINSELLASILKTENNRDDYVDFINEVIEELE